MWRLTCVALSSARNNTANAVVIQGNPVSTSRYAPALCHVFPELYGSWKSQTGLNNPMTIKKIFRVTK